MINKKWSLLSVFIALILLPGSALAQTYRFSLDQQTVNVYWNEDGTETIDYVFVFTNDISASPIDYVDVGLPNSNFNVSNIIADVNGAPAEDISKSGYQGNGVGVALGLGPLSIKPGKTGRVHMVVSGISRVLYVDSTDSDYASAVFVPTYFGSQYVFGDTNLSVTFHLPPGVQPDEPRWHSAPSGWASEPATGFDDEGRIVYTWRNASASGSTLYKFGASFPSQYVPKSAIIRPSFWASLGISQDDLYSTLFCGGFIAFIVGVIVLSARSTQKRKMQYMPPKIAIEGHGIKRGLTAIEAAILLEQPLDKILTMMLFAVIKKGAATVVQPEPLELDTVTPPPSGLHPYEVEFLQAFANKNKRDRSKALQSMMIELVKSVSNKMKGFSRRETIAYYRDIIKRAWAQVETAQTPEVKSAKFDQVMEWTMLDKDYNDRTRDVFRSGPVFVPTWWPRYDPVYRRTVATAPRPTVQPGSVGGGGISLPHLPGSDFAASIVKGVQNFSSNVVGNITDFTNGVTKKTNPVPVSTSSRSSTRSGGGCACACACACAGCACACAGGGR